jgi:hypothetical protein
MLRLAAWPPLSGLTLAATNVLFPHRSLANHSWCAQTETWVIVAAKNRACCPGLRISKATMKMLCPRDQSHLRVILAGERSFDGQETPKVRQAQLL